jgi:hypothetical protein
MVAELEPNSVVNIFELDPTPIARWYLAQANFDRLQTKVEDIRRTVPEEYFKEKGFGKVTSE